MDLLPRIEIDGASKTIGNSVVLDQIQLTVKPGEMIGLQGVNGSGKTMLLRLISGLIYPTKGHVLIDGKMLGSDLEFPPSIGFLIENPTFLPQYTGAENLQMLSSLHQMMPTAQIESVLQRVGLHGHPGQQGGSGPFQCVRARRFRRIDGRRLYGGCGRRHG